MAKTCPSCGYKPIGPYTDNCPMCAEPVRNVRSDRGGSGNSSNVLWWVLGGVGVVLALGVLFCGMGMWWVGTAVKDAQQQMAQAQADFEAERQARTVVVDAVDLLKAFEKDAAAAEEIYADKYLELTGVVERVGTDRFSTMFVILHGGDDNAKIKVECFFAYAEGPDEGKIKRLKKGQRITIRGEYDTRVSNIQLQECVLVTVHP